MDRIKVRYYKDLDPLEARLHKDEDRYITEYVENNLGKHSYAYESRLVLKLDHLDAFLSTPLHVTSYIAPGLHDAKRYLDCCLEDLPMLLEDEMPADWKNYILKRLEYLT